MREYVSGLFLILDSRQYTDDMAFLAISPYEGQHTIIVKGGNRETSKRGKSLDIGNAIKAKLYKRHHLYFCEADIVESFGFLKTNLTTITLLQILLAVLKHTYYLPERQFFFSVYNTLLDLNESKDEERAELGLFLTIMKILNYYDLIEFPLTCQVCQTPTYKGNYDYMGFYCDDHRAEQGTDFSLFTPHTRSIFLQQLLKDLLYITITFQLD